MHQKMTNGRLSVRIILTLMVYKCLVMVLRLQPKDQKVVCTIYMYLDIFGDMYTYYILLMDLDFDLFILTVGVNS